MFKTFPKLRRVTMADAENLLKWKNEEDTRKNSIVTDAVIKIEDHLVWLEKTLNDPTVDFWIVEYDGQDMGDVRLNHGEEETEVSIRLDKSCRGKGLATDVIGIMSRLKNYKLDPDLSKVNCKRLVAKITAHNLASMRVFITNGYKPYEYIRVPYSTLTGRSIDYYIFKQ